VNSSSDYELGVDWAGYNSFSFITIYLGDDWVVELL